MLRLCSLLEPPISPLFMILVIDNHCLAIRASKKIAVPTQNGLTIDRDKEEHDYCLSL